MLSTIQGNPNGSKEGEQYDEDILDKLFEIYEDLSHTRRKITNK